MSDATWHVEEEDEGTVRLRVDRPGYAAMSVPLDAADARNLIEQLAEGTGLTVEFLEDPEEPVDPEPA